MSAAEITPEMITSLSESLKSEKSDWNRLEKRFLKDAMLHRYLRATQGDIHKAKKMVLATIDWRAEFGIDTLSAKDVEFHFKQGKNYARGFDKQGRPVKYDTNEDIEGKVRTMLYQVERSLRRMPKGVEQAVWLIDCEGFHAFFLSPAHCKMALKIIDILGAHYPERLGGLFIFNSPWIFNAFWNICIPFVDKKTASKIRFIKKKEEAFELFHEEYLEEGYFGTNPYSYNHEVDFAQMLAEEEEWLAKNLRHIARHKEKQNELAQSPKPEKEP